MGLSYSVKYWFKLPGKIKDLKGNSEFKDDPYRPSDSGL